MGVVIKKWLLLLAMRVAGHPFLLALSAAAVAGAWYFDIWPLLLVVGLNAIAGVLLPDSMPAYAVRPADEPELTELVRSIARRQGFDEQLLVRIIPVVDASLSTERVEGSRTHVLHLGWPMVRMLSSEQLSAVISHELAHEVDLATPIDRLLVAARWHLSEAVAIPFVTAALLRATGQGSFASEYAADQVSARVIGPSVCASALRRTNEIQEFFDSQVDHWIGVMTQDDEYPADVYTCAERALQDPEVLEWVRANDDAPVYDDPRDSHPTINARVARLAPPTDLAGRPGVAIRHVEEIERWCLDEVFDLHESELEPASIELSAIGRFDIDPEEALNDLAEATETTTPRDALLRARDQIFDGSWPRLAEALAPDLREAPEGVRTYGQRAVIINCVSSALATPLIAGGWERANPWVNHLLVSPAGAPTNVFAVVQAAIDGADRSELTLLVDAADLEGVAIS